MSVRRGDGGRCLLPRCPEGFCRTGAGTLSLLHGWSREREPFTSAQEKRAAVELHFLAPINPFQTKRVNHQALCLQLKGLGGSDSSRSKHTQSKTVPHSPLCAHVVPPDPNPFPPSRLPRARVAAGAARSGWWGMRLLLGEK